MSTAAIDQPACRFRRRRTACAVVACCLSALAGLCTPSANAQSHGGQRPSAATTLSVAGRDFDPLRHSLNTYGSASEDAQGRGLRLVQWQQQVRQSDLDQLQALGLEPLQYYPDQAYLVWGDRAALGRVGEAPGVRWAGDFGPGLKRSPNLSGRQGRIDQVSVHFHVNGSAQSTLAAMAALGAQIVAAAPAQPDGRLYNASLRIDAALLPALAQIAEVIWFGYQSPQPYSEDEITALALVGNPPSGTTPVPGYLSYLDLIDLDGSGVIWGVSDEGIDLTHPEFIGRISSGYSFPGCLPGNGPGDDSPSGGHGTHVAGILGGSGAGAFTDPEGFLYGLGVAPNVQLYAQNVLCRGGSPTFPPEGGWQSLSKRALEASAVGTNLSFTTGEGIRHGYQSIERLFDVMVRDGNFDTSTTLEPFAMVFSAGNSGPVVGTLTAPKEAKNVIVVGATQSPRGGDPAALVSGSSRGPAQDGRAIPTVIAPGLAVASSRRLDGGALCNQPVIPDAEDLYAFCSGTSMAAPHVSGLAALIVQWWRLHYPGTDPSPAMLKALLIEGAEDSASVPGAIPNPDEGWGRAMLPQMIRAGRAPWTVDQTAVLDDSGESHRYALRPINPQLPVRIALAWTDAPGAVGATPALVNDLDLLVRRGSSRFLGNRGAAGTGQLPDRLNNSEVVFLSPSEQPLVVAVQAHAIPGDGLPYHGDATDQDYALVCHNCKSVPGFDLDAGGAEVAICAGQPAHFELPLLTLDSAVGSVSASLGTLPEGISASVTPTTITGNGQFAVDVGNTAGMTSGSYALNLELASSEFSLTAALSLRVVATTPPLSALLAPGEGLEVSSLRPLLRWSSQPLAADYRLQIATSPDFSSPLLDLQLVGTEFRPSTELNPETTYYWRVTPANACGAAASASASFRTPALPGSCPAGTRKLLLYSDTLEPPQAGWMLDGGANTWQISESRAVSPSRSWKAVDFAASGDQRLNSPLLSLPPASERPVLSFSHWRSIERRDATLCWDGAVIDLIDDAGVAQAADPERYQSGAPERVMTASSPSPGRAAWCGQSDFETVHLDLRDVASQSTRVRFRMLSDGRVGGEGWYVDDVQVHSCVPEDVLFRNGMGAEGH